MSDRQHMSVPARYYARVAEILDRQGTNIGALFARAQVPLSALASPDAEIGLDQIERLFAEISQEADLGDLAFAIGESLKLSSHGILGYGLLTSPTLDYAFRLLARYFSAILPMFRLRYRHQDGMAEAVLTASVRMSPICLNFHIEAAMIAWYWEVRELLQGEEPRFEVYLSTPPHAAQHRYEAMRGMTCHFGWPMAAGMRVLYPRDLVKRKLALADSSALKIAEQRCAEAVRRIESRGSLADWVEHMVWDARDEMPTLENLAEAMNMSPRTLDRRLKEEGRSFRAMTNSIRHQRACALLEAGELSVLEIAYELGYADPANFTRAFRKQAGCAPSVWASAQAGSNN